MNKKIVFALLVFVFLMVISFAIGGIEKNIGYHIVASVIILPAFLISKGRNIFYRIPAFLITFYLFLLLIFKIL